MDKDNILQHFTKNRLNEAEALLQPAADSGEPWALYMLGRIAWKRGRKTDAISFYEKAAASDPKSEAAVALEQAREIMNFFHTDLYNP